MNVKLFQSFAVIGLTLIASQYACAQQDLELPSREDKIELDIGDEKLVRLDLPVSEVLVSRSGVVRVVPTEKDRFVIAGQHSGTTELRFYDNSKQLVAKYLVSVAADSQDVASDSVEQRIDHVERRLAEVEKKLDEVIRLLRQLDRD